MTEMTSWEMLDRRKLRSSERLQEAHYDRIIHDYEIHATDTYTRQFRRRFIDEPMLSDIDLRGRTVLEAMCGHGGETGYLLSRGASVTGLDISQAALAKFRQCWPGGRAIAGSILDASLRDESFDCVVAVGGLHHLHPHVDDAIDEIHRVLKPGGYFCFSDPHADSILHAPRRLWYHFDPLFEKNEAGIDVPLHMARNSGRFEFLKVEYLGNIAYLLVLNSLAFRVPPKLKRLYSPLAIALEARVNRVLSCQMALYVVCQWRKR